MVAIGFSLPVPVPGQDETIDRTEAKPAPGTAERLGARPIAGPDVRQQRGNTGQAPLCAPRQMVTGAQDLAGTSPQDTP